MFGKKRPEVLTGKDKAYIDALVRTHGVVEAMRRLANRPLVTKELLQAAKDYVKKG